MKAQSSVPARHENAIALACDAGFLPYAAFLAAEIARAHPERGFDIVIAGENLPDLPPEMSAEVRLVRLSGENPYAVSPRDARRSTATYLRLILPDVVEDYARLLYLDSDIRAVGSVAEVLKVDLKGQALGAVRDTQQWRTPGRRTAEHLAMNRPTRPYFNGGVLLFDTERRRGLDLGSACLDAARSLRGRCAVAARSLRGRCAVAARSLRGRCAVAARSLPADAMPRFDQSVTNLALDGAWTEMSPVWNWQWTAATRFLADDADARLIHFIGPRKPWSTPDLPPRFTRDYAGFLARHSPQAPRPPENKPPRLHRLAKPLLKTWFRLGAMERYLARFPTPDVSYTPD